MIDVSKQIKELNKQLYPTGRAWAYVHGSEQSNTQVIEFVDRLGNPFVDGFGNSFIQTFGTEASPSKRLVNAFLKSDERYYDDLLSLLNQIIADNASFDETDASNWERVYALNGNDLTLEERKANILRRQSYPNGVVERCNYLLIEDELQAAGFNVFVHENRFWSGSEWEVVEPTNNADEFERIITSTGWTIQIMREYNFNPDISNYRVKFDARISNNISGNQLGNIGILTPNIAVAPITTEWQEYTFGNFISPTDTIRIGLYNISGGFIQVGTKIQIRNFRVVDIATENIIYEPSNISDSTSWNISELSYTICANYIDELTDSLYFSQALSTSEMGEGEMGNNNAQMEIIPKDITPEQLRATFFIGSDTLFNPVNVPLSRKDEFRQLILKLKPAQTIAWLFVNYI